MQIGALFSAEMNANSAGSKKKKNAAAKKKANAVVTDVPTAISQVPPSAATSIPNQYPLSPSSAPIDIVYNATADKADQTVEFYQEDEVQKFLSADHPLEMKSLASTMSLGELSHDVPTVVQSSQPVSSLLSIMISMLFCAIISVVGDCTNATSQHSTDCGDCNVVSAETWTVLQPSKRSVSITLSISNFPISTHLIYLTTHSFSMQVLLSISTALNACESIGVEEALTDKVLIHEMCLHIHY